MGCPLLAGVSMIVLFLTLLSDWSCCERQSGAKRYGVFNEVYLFPERFLDPHWTVIESAVLVDP